jgi:hypothetical protein
MTVKISALQIENLKRVKALHLAPSENGLTVIGGKNGQGKTSVLDGVLWALGGGRYAPSNPQREGALNAPLIDLTLSNGIKVKRTGKSSTLTVLDPSGNKAGQALLDAFVGQFALDLPRFLNGNAKDKANTLLKTLGIGDQLAVYEKDEKRLYDEREVVGRIARAKKAHAEELPEYPDAPEKQVSVSDLLKEQQAILAVNGENQRKRDNLVNLKRGKETLEAKVKALEADLAKAREALATCLEDLTTAEKTAAQLQDESTEALEASIANIEAVNASVAANSAKAAAFEEAATYQSQYDDLTGQIEDVRNARIALLEGANLPLPGLSVEDSELLFNGQKWDCMSGSEQLRVAVAIVRSLNPECGFVLMDKLEQMDVDTMREFGAWLEQEGLQVIATRVSTDKDECSIIIEDGLPQGETYIDQVTKNEATEEEYF